MKKYISIRALAQRGPLSEYALRRMRSENQLPGIQIGCKYLVNVEQFDAMLESISASAVVSTATKNGGGGVQISAERRVDYEMNGVSVPM